MAELPRDAIRYNPTAVRKGWDYYSIGIICRILIERCDRPEVQDICENVLTMNPTGIDLRNNYILPIRVGLQEWRVTYNLARIIKVLLSRVLNDSVEGGIVDYRGLSTNTIIAWDISKMLDEAVVN